MYQLTSRTLVVVSLLIIQDATGVEENSSGGNHTHDDCNMKTNCALDYQLGDLTSNGFINITADVMLLSIVSLVGLENVSIIGHDNPTVNCDNAGGIYFDNCHNCTIIGITWEKCGNKTDSKSAIELYNSSNIIIQNCSFKNSVAQAIALSEISGNVSINSCKFVFNNHFKGNGTAIYYLSKIKHRSKFWFMISDCNFTQNRASNDNSIVYIGPSSSKAVELIHFINNAFSSNQGTPIYISYQNVIIGGSVMFEGNTVNSGGGMFITNHSDIVFQKSKIKFINNVAINYGGALHIQNSNVLFSATTIIVDGNKARLGGALYIWPNSIIIFKGNSSVTIINNQADDDGGALYIWDNSDVTFKGNSTVTINNNHAVYGGAFYIGDYSNVTFEGNSSVTVRNNLAHDVGGALYIRDYPSVTFKGNSTVAISNNQAYDVGGALYIRNHGAVTFKEGSTVTISNNLVGNDGGALYIRDLSDVTFKGNSTVTISNNQANDDGGALHIWKYSNVTFEGNSTVTINNNHAVYGGALYIRDYSNVTFEENSSVTVSNNRAHDVGGAIYIRDYPSVTFKGNSTVAISNNQAYDVGGAIYIRNHGAVTFKESSIVTISNNLVGNYGGAIYIGDLSDVTFKENSTVTINNNQANDVGGALYILNYSNVKFDGNSTLTISNNHAIYGGALYIKDYSEVTFKGNSIVTVSHNQAYDVGGALYIRDYSNITFAGNSTVTISNNQAVYGGGFYIRNHCDVTFKRNSIVTVHYNEAYDGGAFYIRENSNVTYKETSTANINNNSAKNSGGALYLIQNCTISFEEDSRVVLYSNTANVNGGAIFISDNCNVMIKGNSNTTFNENEALGDGGAFYATNDNVIQFQSTVKFNDNKALCDGGALHSSNIMFDNCTIAFNHNEAFQGGAIFVQSIVFKDSSIQFDNNKATLGGALHGSNITFKENTAVTFENNEAITIGGAIYSDNSYIAAKQNSLIAFTNNRAENGGAVYASVSTLLVSEYSTVTFDKNIAGQNGGAIYFNNQIKASFNDSSVVTWTLNIANNYGGAIYSKITQNTKYFNISEINGSSDNTAGAVGNLLYIDVHKSCNNSCLNDRIVGASNRTLYQGTLDRDIASSPKILQLYNTAKCISNESIECQKYYINNIMLGQEIIIYPCLLNYFNRSAEVTQFRISGENNRNYFLQGSEYVSISCNHTIGGISIVGNKSIAGIPLNYSMCFTSYSTAGEDIYTNLIVELSPCHPGFQYQSKSQKCECYSEGEVVSCSGSSSAIKRGYWFGYVTGKPTATFCPINYCNFTCCKTTNGYYHLSPERTNQCRLHRDGTACSNCVKGYTLPYYSSECVNTDDCTTAWTVVVVTLTVLYWIAMVTAVFVMMHYRISVGYLYAITYYYSIVDILLNENVDYQSDGLYIFINIMYSVVKLTPQFLGKLCLMRNISGIDQQFIHYIHPLAASLILVIITLVAKCSPVVTLLISRGIIHVICLLLLVSYTSVTTTSLSLLKYSRFDGVNKIYSYASPHIEYFHGRHLVYGMIALLCTIVVVVGLPLLLLLEPLLNRKINFTKIKPLLDQFQGCYKDKFRWFAAYYMICRLVIITITIVFTSNDFTGQYLLITVCAAIVLIHLMVKPYNATVLNILDGILLLFLVLTTVLLLTEFDESNLAVPVTLLLLILPLIFIGMVYLLACKGNIKGIFTKFFNKVDDHKFDNTEMAARNFDVIVDESMRQNATICAM